MLIRNCKNCNKPHNAALTGIMLDLCRACAKHCEDSYPLIHEFLCSEDNKEYRILDKEAISKELGIPGIFVWVLAKQGRFGQELRDWAAEPVKEYCKRCQHELLSHE